MGAEPPPGDAGAGAGDPPDQRAELRDTPPFLSWRAIYLIVIAALAADIALAAALTVVYG